MYLFFSGTTRWFQIFLTIVILGIAPNRIIADQELSLATKNLFKAINKGDLVQVQISIADGANYKATNTWGITPFDLAVDKGHVKIVHYLLKIINVKNSDKKLNTQNTPTKAITPENSTKSHNAVKPSPTFLGDLSALAEIYTPPPDSGPWSATVITKKPPSKGIRVIKKNKFGLKQSSRDLPLKKPIQLGKTSSQERSQIDEEKNIRLREKEPHQDRVITKKTSRRITQNIPGKKLYGVSLNIGRMTSLNKTPPPKNAKAKFYKSCINKKLGSLIFCIENLDWPESIRPYFLTDSILSQDTHTIVRYDRGAATYFHTLFPSNSYAQIVKFFTQRFGAPTQKIERSIAPLAEKRRNNPTVTWQSIMPTTDTQTTLEIRMYDDNRGDFPDIRRGAVYLYNTQSQAVFPHVSMVELMLLRAGETHR